MKASSRVSKLLKQMEVEDHKAFLVAHHQAWELVNALLTEEEERVSKELYKEADYDSANWDLLKADQSGQLRLIKKLKAIIED